MKMTVIPIVFGVIGTVLKVLEKRLGELEIIRIESIQTTALLESVGILR